MNSNWRNRPTTLDYIPENIDLVIGIDESGSSNLKQVLAAKRDGRQVVESEVNFTITACAIKITDFIQIRDMVMSLKNKYWENALFDYKGAHKRVCFHSREIRGKREAFNPSHIDYDSFISDLSMLMGDISIKLFASNIDKVKHVNRYVYPDSPYDLCMNFVLERIMMGLGVNQKCIIVLESRGLKEDKELLNQIKHLIDHGNNYYSQGSFKKIQGVYFNPKWCHIADDKMSYWGLELADLCAYPIHKLLVYGTEDQAYQVIKNKIYHYPQIWGYGLKNFP